MGTNQLNCCFGVAPHPGCVLGVIAVVLLVLKIERVFSTPWNLKTLTGLIFYNSWYIWFYDSVLLWYSDKYSFKLDWILCVNFWVVISKHIFFTQRETGCHQAGATHWKKAEGGHPAGGWRETKCWATQRPGPKFFFSPIVLGHIITVIFILSASTWSSFSR